MTPNASYAASGARFYYRLGSPSPVSCWTVPLTFAPGHLHVSFLLLLPSLFPSLGPPRALLRYRFPPRAKLLTFLTLSVLPAGSLLPRARPGRVFAFLRELLRFLSGPAYSKNNRMILNGPQRGRVFTSAALTSTRAPMRSGSLSAVTFGKSAVLGSRPSRRSKSTDSGSSVAGRE